MTITSPRRPHLVERAVDAARATISSETATARQSLFGPQQPGQTFADAPDPAVEPIYSTRILPADPPQWPEQPPLARDVLARAGLVGDSPMRQTAREEIALAREQLLRAIDATPPLAGRDARIVVVTSARGAEGKSFVALNLAASIAESAGRPVILLDTEGGPGSLTDRLDLNEAEGLGALRGSGGPDPASLTVQTAVPGLSVLPRGRGGPSQADGFAAIAMRIAGRLPQHILMLDTPACLEASTAGLLAAAAGQLIVVVQAEKTHRAELEAALDMVDACPNLQLLLNRVTLAVSGSFGERSLHTDHATDRAQG